MSIYKKVKSIDNIKTDIHYVDEPLDAFGPLTQILKPGDLFLTLGAGNNWPLGLKLYEHYL